MKIQLSKTSYQSNAMIEILALTTKIKLNEIEDLISSSSNVEDIEIHESAIKRLQHQKKELECKLREELAILPSNKVLEINLNIY